MVAFVLFVMPWVGLLLLRGQHLDTGTLVAVIFGAATASTGLPTLWLTWAAFREAGRSGAPVTGLGLGQVADQLAVAVGAQWEAEAGVRRLNDPYPLSVSWASADPSLTDSWESLVKLATSGAGWPRKPAGVWAEGPHDLSGEGSELADVLCRVPTGRLVVLGEPGAGKTMLMVRVVLDLLRRRPDGGPVPFLASVASWNPRTQALRDWLASRLVTDYPALAGPVPVGVAGSTLAGALLAAELIIPLLDGLDEIAEEARGLAVSRISDALRPGEQVVLTCRTEEYRNVVRPAQGGEVTLRAAAAVQLRPVDAAAVGSYLCDDAAGPIARARWQPVLDVLGSQAPAGQALGTPLMIGLARAIYNPRPGESVSALRDPAELCDAAVSTRARVESLLFDAFIPAAYRRGLPGRWTQDKAESWLVFLAQHLEHVIGSPDLAWWQLRKALPSAYPAIGGQRPARGIRLSLNRSAYHRLKAVLKDGAKYGAGFRWNEPLGWLGVLAILPVALADVPRDLEELGSPRAVLARDRQMAFVQLLLFGGWCGAVAGLAAGLVAGLSSGMATTGAAAGLAVGLLFGPLCGIAISVDETAWPSYTIARSRLAWRRRLPWSLMAFLADAHQRGVLRQEGAVYQFRHRELQRRLAARHSGPHLVGSAQAPDDTRPVTVVTGQPERPVTGDAAALADQADDLCKRARFADAESVYRQALELDHRLARAHAGLGRALIGLRRHLDAERACREAIGIDPALVAAHSTLGRSLAEQKRFPEAEAASMAAIRMDPANPLAHADFGFVLFHTRRFREAEAEFRQAIVIDPDLAAGHSGLGLVLLDARRFRAAEASFREAIRLAPDLPGARTCLGIALFERKRYLGAIWAFREATQLDPGSATAHNGLGNALLRRGRLHEAEGEFRKAIDINSNIAAAHNGLGIILYRAKRYEEAAAEFEEVIRISPNHDAARKSLRKLPQREAQNLAAAADNARRAHDGDDADGEPLYPPT